MPTRQTVSVAVAAERLGISSGTVHNRVRDGLLGADRGSQPKRPRLAIWVDARGQPLDPRGRVVRAEPGRAVSSIAELEARVAALEQQVASATRGASGEAFRDAALQLQQAMDRQRRALDLQLRAFQELNEAVAEQANVIAGLLVGDPAAHL